MKFGTSLHANLPQCVGCMAGNGEHVGVASNDSCHRATITGDAFSGMGAAVVQRLPQQMSLAEFLQVAKAEKLENHGRVWEVKLNGLSLGFADGLECDALMHAHFREVNNALFANDGGAPAFYKAELPSHDALASYPDLARRFPYAVAQMVAAKDKAVG